MMTKRLPEQEHMPIIRLDPRGQNDGKHVDCDYCEQDASWYHWADPRMVNRDAFACDDHVRFLNKYYATLY